MVENSLMVYIFASSLSTLVGIEFSGRFSKPWHLSNSSAQKPGAQSAILYLDQWNHFCWLSLIELFHQLWKFDGRDNDDKQFKRESRFEKKNKKSTA